MKLSKSSIQLFIDSDEHKRQVRENLKNGVYHPYSLPIAEKGFEQAKKQMLTKIKALRKQHNAKDLHADDYHYSFFSALQMVEDGLEGELK